MDSAALIAGAVFLWVVALVAGTYYLFVLRPETTAQDVLRHRIRTGGGAVRVASSPLLKEAERLSTFGPLNRLLSGNNTAAANLRRVIHHSGLKVTPGQVVLGSACLALIVYLIVVWFWHFPVWLAAIVGAASSYGPYALLAWTAQRRLSQFEEQFPEAVSLLSRTLRAGHAFTTGLRFAAEELSEPVAGEFRLMHDQQTFGMPLPDGLKAFAERVPIIDARFFVTAVLTQMESGGNLAEVLDNLAEVIRERFKIKRQLRVLTAHGRLTGLVLGALPPALAVYLLLVTPDHMSALTETSLGHQMIAVAVGLQLVGVYLIRKISNVEY
jgi:tight adherence protein B